MANREEQMAALEALAKKLGVKLPAKKEPKKMARGGSVAAKKMRGGGMMKTAAKKKMMRGGGMAKTAKKRMMRGGMAAKKKAR